MKKNIILLFLVGLAGMIIQISILDILLSYFTKSSIVTGTVIGGWIFGLGIGGVGSAKIIKKEKNKKYIILFQFILGILALLLVKFVSSSYSYLNSLGTSAFVLTLPFVVFIGFLSGTTFLLINGLYKQDKDVTTAKLYSSENFGAAISSLLAGIILIPFLGISVALLIAGSLCLLVSFMFSLKQKIVSSSIAVIFIVILIILLPLNSGLQEGELFKQQSPYGEVIVLENTFLQINGRTQCAFEDYPSDISQKTIVNYTLSSFNSKDLDILVIGLGCGRSLKKTLNYTNNQIKMVEINKAVANANIKMSTLLRNKQIKLIIDDGLHYLREDEEVYDAIFLDVENPSVVHSSNLFTTESFKVVKDSLKEEGVFGLWIYPCHKEGYFDIIYNTLKEHFNYVYHVDSPIFIASDLELDYENYISSTKDKRINTINKKILSTFFLNGCWRWEKDEI